MAQKMKHFKMTLKNVATMTVGIDMREIWKGGRNNIHIYGIFLKDAPSKIVF
jgi:hypothetical protein